MQSFSYFCVPSPELRLRRYVSSSCSSQPHQALCAFSCPNKDYICSADPLPVAGQSAVEATPSMGLGNEVAELSEARNVDSIETTDAIEPETNNIGSIPFGRSISQHSMSQSSKGALQTDLGEDDDSLGFFEHGDYLMPHLCLKSVSSIASYMQRLVNTIRSHLSFILKRVHHNLQAQALGKFHSPSMLSKPECDYASLLPF